MSPYFKRLLNNTDLFNFFEKVKVHKVSFKG